jgi:hypothetical protein
LLTVFTKGKFEKKHNKLYKKLFDIDLFKLCGSNGPERPLVPKFEGETPCSGRRQDREHSQVRMEVVRWTRGLTEGPTIFQEHEQMM